MATAEQVYDEDVRTLPPGERLRLAAMILRDLTQRPGTIEFSDAWSEEDTRDVANYAQDVLDGRCSACGTELLLK